MNPACLGSLPSATSDIQPVLVIAGVSFNASRLADLTRDFIDLKVPVFSRGARTS